MKKNVGKSCSTCGQVFDPSIMFCPSDGTKLSTELVTASSHEVIHITTRFELKKEAAAAAASASPTHTSGPIVLDKVEPSQPKPTNGSDHSDVKKSETNQKAFTPVVEAKAVDIPAMYVTRGAISKDDSKSDDSDAEAEEQHQWRPTLIGKTLDNQYEIISVIGKGGMSFVYKAKHLSLNKIVAIKTLLPHLTVQAHSLQRFHLEAKAASGLKHPNIIAIHNFGTTPDGEPYLVMDYVEGTSLADEIEKYGFVSVDRAVDILIQVADALSHAHANGIIHRDLKPSNILLLTKDGHKDHVNLVDFGIAKMLPQDGAEAVNLTQTGEVFGSPLYMSPEQCRGEKLDVRSDIYSFGCLMYETLTGRPAMPGDNTMEVLYNHINVVPSPMQGPLISVPGKLEKIVFQTLAKDPAQRYQTMDQVREALQKFSHNRRSNIFNRVANIWALFWLRRKPRTAKEKAIYAIAIGGIIVAGLLGTQLVSLYWSAADSPAAKTQLIWDEDKEQQKPPKEGIETSKTPLDVMYHLGIAKGMEAKHGDPSEIVNTLQRSAEYLDKRHLWQAAVTLYKKALELSTKYNDYTSLPTINLHMMLAQCYVSQHKYEEAIRAYTMMLTNIHKASPNDFDDEATFATKLGTVYYYQGQWQAAANCLASAYNLYTTPPANRHYLSFFHAPTDIQKDYDYILLTSRLASCYQRMYEASVASGKPDDNTLQLSVEFYHCAYKLWKDFTGAHATNHGASIALANYVVLAHKLDRSKDLDDDYKAALAGVKEFGEESPYYGVLLQSYSNYLFDRGRFFDAIANRIHALQIFAQDKGK